MAAAVSASLFHPVPPRRPAPLIAGHRRRYPPQMTRDHCDSAMNRGAERDKTGRFAAPEHQIPRMTLDHGTQEGHRAPRRGLTGGGLPEGDAFRRSSGFVLIFVYHSGGWRAREPERRKAGL